VSSSVHDPRWIRSAQGVPPMGKVTIPFAAVAVLAWILAITVINASAH
jgi:hypothetical protein